MFIPVWFQARPIKSLRHAPSFQQFGFRVLRVSHGNLFSGSLIDQAGFDDASVNSGMRDSGSEMKWSLFEVRDELFWNGDRWYLQGHH